MTYPTHFLGLPNPGNSRFLPVEDHLYKSKIIKVLILFLVGPLRTQELSDPSGYQQPHIEISCAKKLEARIRVYHGFHNDIICDINESGELYQMPY